MILSSVHSKYPTKNHSRHTTLLNIQWVQCVQNAPNTYNKKGLKVPQNSAPEAYAPRPFQNELHGATVDKHTTSL